MDRIEFLRSLGLEMAADSVEEIRYDGGFPTVKFLGILEQKIETGSCYFLGQLKSDEMYIEGESIEKDIEAGSVVRIRKGICNFIYFEVVSKSTDDIRKTVVKVTGIN